MGQSATKLLSSTNGNMWFVVEMGFSVHFGGISIFSIELFFLKEEAILLQCNRIYDYQGYISEQVSVYKKVFQVSSKSVPTSTKTQAMKANNKLL